jgi:hypothetical protein
MDNGSDYFSGWNGNQTEAGLGKYTQTHGASRR